MDDDRLPSIVPMDAPSHVLAVRNKRIKAGNRPSIEMRVERGPCPEDPPSPFRQAGKHRLPLIIEGADGSVAVEDSWSVPCPRVMRPVAREEVHVEALGRGSMEAPGCVNLLQGPRGEKDRTEVMDAHALPAEATENIGAEISREKFCIEAPSER